MSGQAHEPGKLLPCGFCRCRWLEYEKASATICLLQTTASVTASYPTFSLLYIARLSHFGYCRRNRSACPRRISSRDEARESIIRAGAKVEDDGGGKGGGEVSEPNTIQPCLFPQGTRLLAVISQPARTAELISTTRPAEKNHLRQTPLSPLGGAETPKTGCHQTLPAWCAPPPSLVRPSSVCTDRTGCSSRRCVYPAVTRLPMSKSGFRFRSKNSSDNPQRHQTDGLDWQQATSQRVAQPRMRPGLLLLEIQMLVTREST